MDKASWLSDIFSNPIASAILIIGILAIIITLGVLGKKGLLRVSIKGVSIGNGETERMICRQQIEYCKAAVDTFIEKVGYTTDNRYRARYIAELALDVLIESICYNHITTDSFYINGKVEKIWALVMKYAITPDYKTEDFKDKVSNEVHHCIEHLVEIRKYYSKKD